MLEKALNNRKPDEMKKKSIEYTEEDYEQINKDISKALVDMKKDNNDEENKDENNEEQNIENFDIDFFSDSSNSISFDNFSDISELSFKSANLEMKNFSNKNSLLKNNINTSPFSTKIIRNPNLSQNKNADMNQIPGNQNINFQNNFSNNLQKQRNNNNNNIFNRDNIILNNNNKINVFYNENNQFPLSQINTNLNQNFHINNPLIRINNLQPLPNFDTNNFKNIQINSILPHNAPNFQIINNNINNNLNFINPNPNNFINNHPFNNMNNINMNNNQYLMNYRKSNSALFSYPAISDRGVPGLFNLESPKNIIYLENIIRNKDKRTTLIIRNIPNKYTIAMLLEELNHNFENKYDIVYLPQDYINNSNLGFGFINFLEPLHLIYFYEEFVGKKWNFFNSKKRCNLAYSKYQGKNELIKYILNKLGISNLDNNNQKIKISFYINNQKNIKAPIEIPLKYYNYFMKFHPFSLCHIKDDKVFIIDKYNNI